MVGPGLPWQLRLYRICLQCRRSGSVPGLGRSSGEGNGYPLQYSCLRNPVNRVAWWATVPGPQRVRRNWKTNTVEADQLCLTLQLHGMYPTRIPCPWGFLGNNIGVSCHFLLQGIFLIQGSHLQSSVSPGLQADSFPAEPVGKHTAWALTQYDWYSYKKGKSEFRDTHPQWRKTYEDTQGGGHVKTEHCGDVLQKSWTGLSA